MPLPGVPGLPIVYVPPRSAEDLKRDREVGNWIERKLKETLTNIITTVTLVDEIKNNILQKSHKDKCPNAKNNQDLDKQKHGTPRNNKNQNKQVDDIVKKYKLNKKQRAKLHKLIHGQNLSYREIEEIAIEIVNGVL